MKPNGEKADSGTPDSDVMTDNATVNDLAELFHDARWGVVEFDRNAPSFRYTPTRSPTSTDAFVETGQVRFVRVGCPCEGPTGSQWYPNTSGKWETVTRTVENTLDVIAAVEMNVFPRSHWDGPLPRLGAPVFHLRNVAGECRIVVAHDDRTVTVYSKRYRSTITLPLDLLSPFVGPLEVFSSDISMRMTGPIADRSANGVVPIPDGYFMRGHTDADPILPLLVAIAQTDDPAVKLEVGLLIAMWEERKASTTTRIGDLPSGMQELVMSGWGRTLGAELVRRTGRDLRSNAQG